MEEHIIYIHVLSTRGKIVRLFAALFVQFPTDFSPSADLSAHAPATEPGVADVVDRMRRLDRHAVWCVVRQKYDPSAVRRSSKI